MSSNFNHNEFAAGDYTYGENGYWNDSNFNAFDSEFPSHDDIGQADGGGQAWNYAPDSFDLAGRSEHQTQPFTWGNNIASNNYLPAGDAVNHFNSTFISVTPNVDTQYHQNTFTSVQDDFTSHSRPPSRQGVTTGPAFPASPYTFENDATVPRPVQPGAIAPQALQLSESAKGSMSRESTPSTRTNGAGAGHLFRPLPKGRPYGNFLVTAIEDLASVANSRQLNAFANVSNSPQDAAVNRSTIPAYVPRKSRNQLMKLLANNNSLKAKIDKKLSKKIAMQSSHGPVSSVIKTDDVKRRASDTPAEESSEDDSSSDESEEESMHPPIPAKRPTDSAVAAMKFDTIKTLWRVPYRSVPAEDIRKAIQGFWENVGTIRDRWKSDNAAVKQAEEAKKLNEVPMLKERVASQRSTLQACLTAAVEHGHRDILENFGQHLQLMGVLAVFIQDRMKESDYSGSLIKAILQFLSKCKSMTNGVLERSQIGKVFSRLSKRGDDSVKLLTKRITDNASSATQKKRGEATVTSNASTNKISKPANGIEPKVASPVAGTKRPREAEDVKQPVKKTAAEKSSTKASTSDAPSKLTTTKRVPSDSKLAAAATTQTTKKIVTAPNLFSSLQPARKLPSMGGVSAQAKITGSDATKPRTPASNVATKGGFSFADAMASLTKPKEPEKPTKQEENRPAESKEERAKRLRKESRRKLRVTFKPEAELQETRYFEHDPEEDFGHEDNQLHDAKDHKSEGQMLKLQHQIDPDAMDIDEEDEKEDAADQLPEEYIAPSEIDFTGLETADGNVLRTYGSAMLKPESAECKEQEKREANTLLVIYTSRSDIPSTPKEPPDQAEEASEPQPFGPPPTDLQEKFSKYQAIEKERQAQQAQQVPPVTEISAILGKLAQHQPQQPQMQQITAPPPEGLEAILAHLAQPQQPQPQAQPPNWQYNPMQVYYPPQQQHHYQQQQQQPPWGAWPTQPQQPPEQQGGPPDIAALLASLQSTGAVPIPPQQSQTSGTPNMGGGALGIPNIGFAQQHPDTALHENDERRQMRDGGAGAGPAPMQFPDGKLAPYRTVTCKYWLEGRCQKGENCTFKHEN